MDDHQLLRYSRHPAAGDRHEGQQRLLDAVVLIIGLGGPPARRAVSRRQRSGN
jgi:molybdopterin/thiamine biosynthesis adenylyltransferase